MILYRPYYTLLSKYILL